MTLAPGAVYLLFNARMPAAEALAHVLAPLVRAAGREVVIAAADDADILLIPTHQAALLVTLGGDGTILRVARATVAAFPDIAPPLLAIDFGKVGFLTELPPDSAATGLSQVLEGQFWLEERRFLSARLLRNGETIEERLALNDVVLARGDGPHAIRLVLEIDGAESARYTADGMIIASPTGSTAYALAAGGPIIHPTMDVMLAVPVAPHLAVARSFVVPAQSTITLTATAYRATVITLDGQITIPYESNDLLNVTTSPYRARFARLGAPNYFYTTLQERLRRN